MDHRDFASAVRIKIRDDMNQLADDLSNGCCRNFDEYQKLCGTISGLARSERYLLDLLENLERNDE